MLEIPAAAVQAGPPQALTDRVTQGVHQSIDRQAAENLGIDELRRPNPRCPIISAAAKAADSTGFLRLRPCSCATW